MGDHCGDARRLRRGKKATAQLLKQEYANLKIKDGESVEDFSLRL